MRLISCLFATTLLLATGCNTDGGDGPDVTFADASLPDAETTPDAAPACSQTLCGAECVDTSSNSNHCGGCNLACDSPGQICSGQLPCACPPDFMPQQLAGQIISQMGFFAGLHFDLNSGSAITVGYDPVNTALDTDIVLSSDSLTMPLVGAAFEVDPFAQSVRTAYTAVEGTINFTRACDVGIGGTLTDVVLVEVDQTTGAQIPGGCTQTMPTPTAFDFGEACVDPPPNPSP
jgi:predicted small secreted protein